MATALRGGAGFLGAWLLVTAAAFALVRAMPGDPVEMLLAAGNVAPTPDAVAALRAAFGLDRPLPVQFAAWLGGFLTLDWGVSPVTGRPILADVAVRAPWSAAIGAGGLAAAVAGGFALGFAAAARPGGLADRASRVLAVSAQALPAFAVGLVLLWLVAVEWRLLAPLTGSVAERLVLPIALVALFSVGAVARVARVAFAEAAGAPYMVTARMKGLSRTRALWRHGRRHAALTVLAAITPEAAWIVGGTAVAEIVFSVPGLSDRVVAAVATRDYALLQAYVALVAFWLLGVHALAALARRRLDPRVGA
ncbi:ABC transporter permease [Salinarimonas chemoclinalis]|uniref:ABC transporter permease n=1 Tax=Salinarimonas chemoclinalis TaxID=3241599 RepID=UPI003557BB1C